VNTTSIDEIGLDEHGHLFMQPALAASAPLGTNTEPDPKSLRSGAPFTPKHPDRRRPVFLAIWPQLR
jgi:hypothetical protein